MQEIIPGAGSTWSPINLKTGLSPWRPRLIQRPGPTCRRISPHGGHYILPNSGAIFFSDLCAR